MSFLVPSGLYLHIPFCSVKCRFCDFAAYPGRRRDIDRYLKALDEELVRRANDFPHRVLQTFYVGGGTPSLLSADEWGFLISSVRKNFTLLSTAESTAEVNPERLSSEKIPVLLHAGINRLSLGLQTHEDSLLKTLGRTHDWRDFLKVFQRARYEGFDNLNVDLMYGLPGQTLSGWRETLKRVTDLGPEHVSAYALTVEDSTWFSRSGVTKDDDEQADFYEYTAQFLTDLGYRHYEISNFAKEGRESRHNLRYWRNQECLGAGVSAAWFDGQRRCTNTDNLTVYLNSFEEGKEPPVEDVILTPSQQLGETLMLALRLKEGIVPNAETLVLHGNTLTQAVSDGLLLENQGLYTPTLKGWRLSNLLFQKFL